MRDLKEIINKANMLVNGAVDSDKTLEVTSEVVKAVAQLAPLNVSEFERKITTFIDTADRIQREDKTMHLTPMTLEELESVEMLIHEVKYAKYQVGFLNAYIRKAQRNERNT